jgi:hypothetical protein
LRGRDIAEMFQAMSREFPQLTLRIWGYGEEDWDIWSRAFRGGELVYERGPFGPS